MDQRFSLKVIDDYQPLNASSEMTVLTLSKSVANEM